MPSRFTKQQMLSSALNALVAFVAIAPAGAAQMAPKDRAAWRSMQPAVASIVRGRRDLGSAALVDSRGLFVTYLGSVYGPHVTARLSDGRIVGMTLRSSDDATQLAVLQADDWIKSARPLAAEDDPMNPGDRLFAILPSGVIRAAYVGARHGLVASSKRLMPLSEINFEAPADLIGGALIVTSDGEIVGFLDAALHSQQEVSANVEPSALEGTTPKSSLSKAIQGLLKPRRKLGPGDMTTAYTIAPNVFRKTMEGLISGRGVDRPSIGVDVKNASGGGALIQSVEPGSSAAESGLKAGDVVYEIDGKEIDDQVDLAKAVLDRPIGASLIVKVKRGRSILIVPVRVESRPAKRPINPEGAT
jgi:S1-C subfamily serine protease